MGPRHSRKILRLINWRVEKQTFMSVGPDYADFRELYFPRGLVNRDI
jgi:hypothetical protein